MALGQSIYQSFIDNMSDPDRKEYTISKASVEAIFIFCAVSEIATKSLRTLMKQADELAVKLDRSPVLSKKLGAYAAEKNKSKIKELYHLLETTDPKKIENLVRRIDEDRISDLLENISNNKALREALIDHPALADSWKILDKAGRNALKTNPDILKKVNKVLNNEKWNNINNLLPIKTANRDITNIIELTEQIVKLQEDASSIVGKRMLGMGDLMDDMDYFLTHFSDKPGAGQLIKELSESGGKMAGGSFVIRCLKNNADELGSIIKFEARISSQADDVGDIIVDVITTKGNVPEILNEFKNWRSITPERHSSFTKQFIAYLSNGNIEEFSYYFKKGVDKVGIMNIDELRKQVIDAFKNQKDLFSNLSNDKFESIFGFSKEFKIIDNSDIQNFVDNNFEKIFKLID